MCPVYLNLCSERRRKYCAVVLLWESVLRCLLVGSCLQSPFLGRRTGNSCRPIWVVSVLANSSEPPQVIWNAVSYSTVSHPLAFVKSQASEITGKNIIWDQKWIQRLCANSWHHCRELRYFQNIYGLLAGKSGPDRVVFQLGPNWSWEFLNIMLQFASLVNGNNSGIVDNLAKHLCDGRCSVCDQQMLPAKMMVM